MKLARCCADAGDSPITVFCYTSTNLQGSRLLMRNTATNTLAPSVLLRAEKRFQGNDCQILLLSQLNDTFCISVGLQGNRNREGNLRSEGTRILNGLFVARKGMPKCDVYGALGCIISLCSLHSPSSLGEMRSNFASVFWKSDLFLPKCWQNIQIQIDYIGFLYAWA